MCCGDSCIVPQTRLFTGCDFFAVNALFGSLFVCSPFSKADSCQGFCATLFWVITLLVRLPLGFTLFMVGMMLDFLFLVIWAVTFCWCCGKCKKWGCDRCLETEKRPATDCLIVMCVFEA